jgi:hypothetical protein
MLYHTNPQCLRTSAASYQPCPHCMLNTRHATSNQPSKQTLTVAHSAHPVNVKSSQNRFHGAGPAVALLASLCARSLCLRAVDMWLQLQHEPTIWPTLSARAHHATSSPNDSAEHLTLRGSRPSQLHIADAQLQFHFESAAQRTQPMLNTQSPLPRILQRDCLTEVFTSLMRAQLTP